MPLSEHEQRQLEQIEQALYREDPKFGRLVRSSDPRVHYKRKLAQALIGVVVGAGLLAAGVVTHRLYLEAAGAAVMLLCPGVGGRQLAAARGQGPPRQARASQGEDEGTGSVRSRPSVQAGPDDGADGRAVAPAPGGRPQDVASAGSLSFPHFLRAAAWVRVVIMEAGKMVARQRVVRRAVAASPRRAVVLSWRRCCDGVGRAA